MAINIRLGQVQTLSQRLQQVLSPRMLQMLKTLNTPYVDLVDEMYKIAEENPTLEMDKQDELFSFAKTLTDYAKDYTVEGSSIERDIKADAPNLVGFLISQLHLEDLDEVDYEVGEMLIDNIDNRGYLQNYPDVKEEIMKTLNVKRSRVDKLLSLVQTFEPDGVGARNLKECLIIQVNEYNFEAEELRNIIIKVIKEHFDLLAKKDFATIAEVLGIQEDGVKHIAEFIEKNLTHNPGFMYRSDEKVTTVIPSFLVKPKDSGVGYEGLNLEEKKGPVLRINHSYLEALSKDNVDEETKSFIREKLESAKQFMEDIQKRHEITQKIIDIIVERQSDFLKDGYYWLKPLQQNELAQILGIHCSTISRAVSTKYAQTPRGLLPLKYLCPRNFKGHTSAQIKGIMLRLLEDNPKMSDQKISDYLKTERGIDIKRRTVTKYRMEQGFSSSRERKKDGK